MKIHKHKIYVVLSLLFFFCGFSNSNHPFKHDLHLFCIPGKSPHTMICFHGMGGDHRIAQSIKERAKIEPTLISFNFPDYGVTETDQPIAEKTTFGTIEELLPAIYVLKKCIIEEGLKEIHLYGLSAGGGALINVLSVLNIKTYDEYLKKIGVGEKEKTKILQVIQKGNIILDVPLKSIDEIIDFRGSSPELEIISRRYKANNLVPINSIKHLANLSLNFIVYFQDPDEVLSNRDDALFIETIKKYNTKGTTIEIIGKDAKHGAHHPLLWEYVYRLLSSNRRL